MSRNRLEAFSDAVIAIVITIMVLELKVPHGADWAALAERWHVFLAYVMSFVFLGIYWNNHHHMMHAADRVDGRVLWANQHLLFWLSLVPFSTHWLGENPQAAAPTATYGIVLLGAACAYIVLQRELVRLDGGRSKLAAAVGRDLKGKVSLLGYVAAIPLAFVNPALSHSLYVFVALLWLIPDRRIERGLPGPQPG
jgi:uncharacterized membrane protein